MIHQNKKIISLFYNNKHYYDYKKIIEILHENDLDWFIDCEYDSAEIEIKNKTLIFNEGVFYAGDFEYGIFKGIFKGGTFINGIFEGKWINGNFKSGIKNEN